MGAEIFVLVQFRRAHALVGGKMVGGELFGIGHRARRVAAVHEDNFVGVICAVLSQCLCRATCC